MTSRLESGRKTFPKTLAKGLPGTQSKRPLDHTYPVTLHFGRRLPPSMHRLTLLFLILGFLPTIYAAAVFEFPDLTRRLPERTTTPGCAYKGERYAHGEQVATTEPCLNCTCIRAVVVCYLRVCPSASAPPPGCFLAREPGQCCPTLVCGGDEKPKPNEGSSAPDLRPTFQPESAKDEETTSESTTTTSRTTTEENSLMFVSSTQPDDDIPFLNDIPGGCLVNGTLYGDGSAMLSSSFCEYCFCIRGKSTCLKPKCDLVIEGCTPHYDSHFSCCPSRYDCYQKTTDKDLNEITEATSTTTTTTLEVTKFSGDYGTCIVDGLIYNQGQVVPNYRLCHNCYCSDGATICDKIKCAPALAGCQPIIPEGHCCPVSYKCDFQADTGNYNIKVAKLNDSHAEVEPKKTVKQSDYFKNNHGPNLEPRPKNPHLINDLTDFFHNFVPVHRRLEDVAELYHSPEGSFNSTDIFSKNNTEYQIAIGETATSSPRENDKTLVLDILKSETETPLNVQNENDLKNTSISSSSPRENDKTLVLDILKSEIETTPLDAQNENDLKNTSISSTVSNTVSVGPPEVQTISIQELFEHRLSSIANISKQTTDSDLEPQRNNSKQSISIVDISDTETTLTHFYNTKETTDTAIRNLTTNATENMPESTTLAPQDAVIHQETTGNIAAVTSPAYKNLDSTLIHTTLNFAEDEEISDKYGSTPFIITGTKRNRTYTKASSTDSLDWFSSDYHSTNYDSTFSEGNTFSQTSTRQTTKLPSRINSKLPSSYNGNDSVLHSNTPLVEDSLINLYLPAEGRDGDLNDFTNVGTIHLGAPLSVEATELRRDSSSLRNKLTESGGVIFMDPKYTDINPNLPTEIPSKSTEINSKQDESSSTSIERSPITPIEKSDNHVNDRKKGPRIQDAFNQTNPGQDYKIIPFVAEDAIRGKFGKINNTFHVLSDTTQSAPDMVSDFCFIKGRIFMNGEMIPKVDPCELCRCFYGQELCQLQRCPTPPPNCVPEKLPAFCCPRYTCAGNSSTFKEQSPPSQRITINGPGSSQFLHPLINREAIGILPSDKPKMTSQKTEETKFGIRVRLRPTTPIPIASTHEPTAATQQSTTPTKKPELIRTPTKPTSEVKIITTSKRPDLIRTPAAIQHSRISTTKEPGITQSTQKVPNAPFDPWGLLKVSGCNIYGKFFNINDQVEILSGPCSHCICTTNGVECNDIC
ncbi:hypothetical protein HNY73_010798 [Argiope bruennichi]|uniref:VWFC domain-containing protein n=1 Tax=Argiope bruennichi TaxID=94029 RepID=A0A8T0F246_ARGBR|nr:hypothetical protein HNY73_010798 [Argiope bruennichi]